MGQSGLGSSPLFAPGCVPKQLIIIITAHTYLYECMFSHPAMLSGVLILDFSRLNARRVVGSEEITTETHVTVNMSVLRV